MPNGQSAGEIRRTKGKMKYYIGWLFGQPKKISETVSVAKLVDADGPKFLLPKTAEKYNEEKDLIEEAARRHEDECLLKAAALRSQADALRDKLASSPVMAELKHRQESRLRDEAHRLVDRDSYEAFSRREAKDRKIEAMKQRLRREEMREIALEGSVLSSSTEVEKVSNCDSSSPCTVLADRKKERRIVRFDGQFFLCHLTYDPVWRGTGKMEKKWIGGFGYGPRYEEEYEVVVPTGEVGPPVVDWVTASLSQFRGQELRALEENPRDERV